MNQPFRKKSLAGFHVLVFAGIANAVLYWVGVDLPKCCGGAAYLIAVPTAVVLHLWFARAYRELNRFEKVLWWVMTGLIASAMIIPISDWPRMPPPRNSSLEIK